MCGWMRATRASRSARGNVEGDDIKIKWDDRSPEVDIVQVDAQDFIGDFDLTLKSISTEDKLYISNVVSFTAFNSKGMSDTYTGQNVYGGGESGDQNGGEFGDGTYDLGQKIPGTCKVAKFYEITYFDRDGNLQTITMDVTSKGPTLALDYICFARGTMIEVQGGIQTGRGSDARRHGEDQGQRISADPVAGIAQAGGGRVECKCRHPPDPYSGRRAG